MVEVLKVFAEKIDGIKQPISPCYHTDGYSAAYLQRTVRLYKTMIGVVTMLNFSKSKYCAFCKCNMKAWLNRYKPGEAVFSDSTLARMSVGNEVGDLAMQYFGDFVEVTEYTDGKIDLVKMVERTKEELAKGTPVICEASFLFGGLYCAVDILRREGDGWAIYEVKSSTHAEKTTYIDDVSYQKYVLEHCGVKVTGTYLVCLDNTYIYDGTLDLHRLFKVTDLSAQVAEKLPEVEGDLAAAEKLLRDKNEPDIPVGLQCEKPGLCEYWGYCTRKLPKPNVFDLYRLSMKKKVALYERGLVDLSSLKDETSITNELQKRQIDFALNDRGTYINKKEITKFLEKLSYPLYFLDFESVQPAVPKYAGTTPYAQVPFQYSLHYIETEGGVLKHKEFLAQAGKDPLRDIAEALCRDIPADACITAYNKGFECPRLKELAGYFPDLSQHLLSIFNNIVDLLVPFQSGWYYNREMGGSFSIKSVLPALFPDDPELDYHNLDGIHNGGEAMNAFPAMEKMSGEELERTRKNLLEYCKLDTLAMVKVWERLKEAAK